MMRYRLGICNLGASSGREWKLCCGAGNVKCCVLTAKREFPGYFFEVGWERRAQSAIPSERQRNPRTAINPIITKAIMSTPIQLEDGEYKARGLPKAGET
jgi:hypothetical protein